MFLPSCNRRTEPEPEPDNYTWWLINVTVNKKNIYLVACAEHGLTSICFLKNRNVTFSEPVYNHHIISSYHNVHFWGASSKTPAPRPLNKQVSFQQCCKCSRGQCRITYASWQAVPDAWAGDSKWSIPSCNVKFNKETALIVIKCMRKIAKDD